MSNLNSNQLSQNIIKDLNWRYATKKFDSTKKINPENIETLTESIRLVPSSFGLQPLKLVVVTNPEIKNKLKDAAFGQSQIADCSHLMVFCAKTNLNQEDVKEYIENTAKIREISVESLDGLSKYINSFIEPKTQSELKIWSQKQAYIALGFLLYSAATLKIDSCPMEGFDPNQFDEILDLKKHNLTATVICPVGYRSEQDFMSKAKKSRFSKERFVINID
jgi:nitroreductase / dihydropteridine reductase